MKLFLDTEFTDLKPNAKLISIALVDENENYFYAELTDTYELEDCSDFVKLWVLPLLRGEPHRMSRMECVARIGAWIEERGEECVVCSDNPGWDLPHLNKLIEYQWPQNLITNYIPIWVPHADQERIVMEGDLDIHNALDDALVMKRYEIDHE
jgi:hypothetical protein